MNDLQFFAQLVNEIFGQGSAQFNTTRDYSNNIIGALNQQNDFQQFKRNFPARLRRLEGIYRGNPPMLAKIIDTVNNIASNNSSGAFAELAAYDHFHLNANDWIDMPLELDVNIDVTRSLGQHLGMQVTNLDGHIAEYNAFFDVKVLKDNVSEILSGIYKEVKRRLRLDDLHITAQHDLHILYNDFIRHRQQLVLELCNALNVEQRPTFVESTVVNGLSYRLLWEPGISTVERLYHPFQHAENYHSTIFNYADKFLTDAKTFIVLVSFPWYNGIVTDFANSNKRFYRAFARRVFCQYIHDPRPFTEIEPAYTGPETIFEVSRNLSGIIFLEDNSILSRDADSSNVSSYVYYNPNAYHQTRGSRLASYISQMRNVDYDDFEFDNY